VLGDGKLGLLIAMVLNRTGCQLTLVGKHAAKMDVVKDYPLQRVTSDVARGLIRSFDVVVEATGLRKDGSWPCDCEAARNAGVEVNLSRADRLQSSPDCRR
jgi:threonine dehydrogenase-like Zn-dependent dehydrogenase